MDITIVVYDGIDVLDLAVPYEIFRHISGVNISIACNNINGEITCKDKSLTLGGFCPLRSVESCDILWICGGESNVDSLLKDDRFKLDVSRLALSANRVVSIGAASVFMAGSALEKGTSLCAHPSFSKYLKKAKLNYIPDVILENQKYISMSSRAGIFPAMFKLIEEVFSTELRDEIFTKLRLENKILLPKEISDEKKRNKNLKKLYKQSLKRDFNKNSLELKVDSTSESYAFYIHSSFNFLSFAFIYSILSNYQRLSMYIVGDKVADFGVEGKRFYVKATHSLHQIKRVHTLVITGGKIIEQRLGDNFLKYWIKELAPKTSRIISLDGADRILGVSGVLADYDPAYDDAGEEGKFVFLNGPGRAVNFIYNKLDTLSNPAQAELYRSEYFL